MSEPYAFLKSYVESLSGVDHASPEPDYCLNSGVDRDYLNKVQLDEQVSVPDELLSLYEFSYGARLGEYVLLTLPEIAGIVREMKDTYKEQWLDGILPVFYVRGVGDSIAMNSTEVNSSGSTLILDGFHELPPAQWTKIGYGLRLWLETMTKNGFRPYWFGK